MKEIDRRGRILIRIIMWGVWLMMHGLFLPAVITAHTGDHPQRSYISYALMSVLFTFGLLYSAYYTVPRVYFSEKGVFIRRFVRKKFYPWSDIQESVILKYVHRTKNRVADINVFYHFYFLTAEGVPWTPSDTLWAYKQRNQKYFLQVPLTEESREYAKRHNIKLVIDQSKGKEILWRLVK